MTFDEASFVRQIISFGPEQKSDQEALQNEQKVALQSSQEALHVAFNVDINFLMQAGVCLTSMVLRNPEMKFAFHIFTSEADDKNLEMLRLTAETYGCTCYIYIMNMEPFNTFHIKHARFKRVSYFRLYMPKLLKRFSPYYAYVDADMLCVGDMSACSRIDLQGHPIGAVSDVPSAAKWLSANLKLSTDRYFNSGFQWVDIDAWEKKEITEKCFALRGADPAQFHCHDQDILNKVLDGDWQELPRKFNDMHTDELEPVRDPILNHFWGRTKPWQIVLTDEDREWRRVLRLSCWDTIEGDFPARTGKNYFIYKEAARHFGRAGNRIKQVECLWWYGFLKVKSRLMWL